MGISSIRSKYTPAGANREIQINDNGVLGSSSGFVLNSSGNVGIGLDNPSQLLHLSGVPATGGIRIDEDSNTAYQAYLTFLDTSGNFGLDVNGGGRLRFATGGTENLTILSSGNVGINQSVPVAKLHIEGNNYSTSSGGRATDGLIFRGGTDGDETYTNGLSFSYGAGSSAIAGVQNGVDNDSMGMAFFTHPSGTGIDPAQESMRIMASGNVLVNTTEQFGSNTTKMAVFSSGQDQLSVIDTTAQAENVGGAISLGGNYRAAGDAQPFVRIRANKSSSTDNNFDYGMAFDTTPNGGSFTQRMYISGAGNVGIGEPSPAAPLHVKGGSPSTTNDAFHISDGTYTNIVMRSGNADGEIRLSAAGTLRGRYAAQYAGTRTEHNFSLGTNDITAITIDTSQRVGIGTDSPTHKLSLSTAGTDGIKLGVDSQTYYHIVRPNGDGLYLGADDGNTGGAGADIRFNVKGTELVRITSAGNVGIGETSPASLLTLKGGNILLEYNSTGADDGHGIFFHTTTNGWSEAGSHAAIYGKRVDASNGYLRFDTRSGGTTDERMRITGDGDVSIGGDATPSARLNVTDEYDADDDIAYFENTHSNGGAFLTIKQYETTASPVRAAAIRLGTKGSIIWHQGILRRGGSDHFNTWSLNTSNDNNTVEAKFAVTTDGRVGINATKPAQFDGSNITGGIVLDARTTSSGAPGISITDVSGVGGGGRGSGYSFRTITNDTGGVITEVGRITAHKDNNVQGDDGGWMAFYTKTNGSSISERMRIHSDGAVSIGNNNLNSTYGILNLSNGNGVGNAALYIEDAGGIGYSLGVVDGSQAFSISEGANLNSQKRFEIDTNGGTIIGGADIRTLYAGGGFHSLLYMEGTPRNDGGNNYEWPGISILANNASTGGGSIDLGHAKGTALGNNTAIVDDDSLGALSFAGADGTAIQRGAVIHAQADGNWSGTNRGTDIVFQTTINGSTAYPSERMRIASQNGSGSVLIGKTTADAHNKGDNTNLEVDGSVSSRTYIASNVGTGTWVNSGFTVGNQMRAYIITIFGRPVASNTYSTAMYVLVSSAYSKVLTQLGTPSSHFGNGELEAQLDSNSAITVNFQVRWAFNVGNTETSDVHTQVLRLM